MVAVQLEHGRAAWPALRAVSPVVALVHHVPDVGLGYVRVVRFLVRVLEQREPVRKGKITPQILIVFNSLKLCIFKKTPVLN